MKHLAMRIAFVLWATLGTAQAAPVAVLEIKGAIGPATTDYLVRGFERAQALGAVAVVIQIDTPGGLDAATRDINQAILASDTPIVTYVYPEGARAASAGTYILYASHVAAMSPATNLGAATPVQIMGGEQAEENPQGQASDTPNDDKDRQQNPDDDSVQDNRDQSMRPPGNAMGRKVVNDAVAYIRGLAERRGRNAEWAEKAVREAASLSASEALENNVIDLVAASLVDLLEQLDGREIALQGRTVVLHTANATIERMQPDWRNRLLATITDPTVAYLLFIIGLYGLLLEGYNPGVLVPGIVGAISLLLALYAFQVLPINYVGVGLILLGLMLIVAETFAPSFGALGIGGVVSLAIGSIILIDSDIPGFVVSRTVIGGIATLSGLLFLGIAITALRTRRMPVTSGGEALIGAVGEVIDTFGRVHIAGEEWLSESVDSLAPGDRVEVVSRDGLKLSVRKQSIARK